MKHLQNKAFTLVELIVVITILAILGTIAFISLQGYSRDARDSTRLSDIKSTETGLELFAIKVGKYPVPDNVVSYTGGSAEIKQGILGEGVTRNTKLNKIVLDPVTKANYVYSTFGNGKYYQLAADVENLQANIISQANAESPISSLVRGNYTFDPILPSLILVPSSVTGSGIFDKNACFVMNGGKNTLNNCVEKKSQMDLISIDLNLVGYWDMETLCNNDECGIGNNGMVKNLVAKDLETLSGTALKTHSGLDFMTQTFTGSAIMGNGSANVINWDTGLESNGIINVIKKEGTISMIFKPNESLYAANVFPRYRHFLFDYQSGYRITLVEGTDIIKGYSYFNSYKYITDHIGAKSKPGFDFIKGKNYLITMVYKNGVVGANNSELSLYINGVLHSTNNIEKGFSEAYLGNKINIGTASTFDACGNATLHPDFSHLEKGCPINGVIDEVRIYSRALTAAQINQQNFIVR